MGAKNRQFMMRKWDGHFDAYDIWTNFAYRGDDNPNTHNHGGLLSGVIYFQNHNHPVHFDEYNCAYAGDNGTMIMFPSHVLHHVKEQTSSKESIIFGLLILLNVMPFDAYKQYLSLKNHFTKEKYDYHKYCGKSRATVQSFYKRKDRFWF